MDVIQTARMLGKAIQEDESYIAMSLAKERNDNDAELQDIIGRFNAVRDEMNEELQKSEQDQKKIAGINAGLKEAYAKIFENQNMLDYNAARDKFQKLMEFVNQIITGSTEGLNPDLIEYDEGCGGACGSCPGCH